MVSPVSSLPVEGGCLRVSSSSRVVFGNDEGGTMAASSKRVEISVEDRAALERIVRSRTLTWTRCVLSIEVARVCRARCL